MGAAMTYVVMNKETFLFLTVDGDWGALDDARKFSALAAAAIAFVYGEDCFAFRVVGPTGYADAKTFPSIS
jgi:hypothetical protein